jgi:hypothetical protein
MVCASGWIFLCSTSRDRSSSINSNYSSSEHLETYSLQNYVNHSSHRTWQSPGHARTDFAPPHVRLYSLHTSGEPELQAQLLTSNVVAFGHYRDNQSVRTFNHSCGIAHISDYSATASRKLNMGRCRGLGMGLVLELLWLYLVNVFELKTNNG